MPIKKEKLNSMPYLKAYAKDEKEEKGSGKKTATLKQSKLKELQPVERVTEATPQTSETKSSFVRSGLIDLPQIGIRGEDKLSSLLTGGGTDGNTKYTADEQITNLKNYQRILNATAKTNEDYAELERIESEIANAERREGLTFGNRVGNAAKSVVSGIVGTIPALFETGSQDLKNSEETMANPEWRALNERYQNLLQALNMDKSYGTGLSTTGFNTEADVMAELDRIAAEMDKLTVRDSVDQNLFGQKAMADSRAYQAEALRGTSDIGSLLGGTAISMMANSPSIVAGIAGGPVGAAAGLGFMGAQAAAQKATELSERGTPAGEALGRGLLSGGVEILTEKLPLDNLASIVKRGGKNAIVSILKQMGIEATEESASYLMNYIADLAAKDPEAKFSLKELAENAIGGGLSGFGFAGIGYGVNRLMSGNRSSGTINTEAGPVSTTDASGDILLRAAEEVTRNGRVTNSTATDILDNPSAMDTLAQEANLSITDGMSKAQQRNAVKTAVEGFARARETAAGETANTDTFQQDALTRAIGNGQRVKYNALTEEQIAAWNKSHDDVWVDADGMVYQMDPAQHISQRTADGVSNRAVNAFQFDHPELRSYYKQAARDLIKDASMSIDQPKTGHYERTTQGKRYIQNILESQPLRYAMDMGLTRKEIIQAAEDLVEDHGQENYAAAKRLEFVLDDMLTSGYTTVEGETFGPNESYIQTVQSIPGYQVQERDELPIWDMDDASYTAAQSNTSGPATLPARARNDAELAYDIRQVKRAGSALGENGSRALSAVYDADMARYYDPKDVTESFFQVYNAALNGEKLTAEAEKLASAMPEHLRIAAESAAERDAVRATQAKYFGDKAGLARDANWKKAHLSSKTSRVLDALGKALGVEVRFAETVNDGQANAQYKNGVITIALDANDPVLTSLVHEIVHRVREASPGAYQTLADFVRQNMTEEGMDFNLAQRARLYQTTDADYLTEEMVADAFGQMLGNEDVMGRFAQENRTLAQRITDALADIVNAIQRILRRQNLMLTEAQKDAFRDLKSRVSAMERILKDALKEASAKQANALQGKHGDGTMGATRNSLKEDLENGRARKEERGAFLQRAAGAGYAVYEGKTAAYGYRGPVQLGHEAGAKQVQEELQKLGITGIITDGIVLWNRNGLTRVSQVKEAATAHGEVIFINGSASIPARRIAGHEAFHLWKNGVGRDGYIETVEDNLIFTNPDFLEYQSAIAEAYLGGEADISNDAQVKKLREELFAYISGDIHEGVNDDFLRPMFRDFDAVKAAWNELVDLNSGKSRYSIKEDSKGRMLTEAQREYFRDSKAVDGSGRLLALYHQTDGLFTVFDPRHQGAGSRDNATPFGIFLKTSDRDIGLNGKFQMELYANITNPLYASNREALTYSLLKLSDEYATIKAEIDTLDVTYHEKFEQAKHELRDFMTEWRNKNPGASRRALYDVPEFNALYEAEDAVLEEWTQKADQLSAQAKNAITAALRNAGYDGVILSTDAGSFGRSTDAYIALDPEQVKNASNKTPTSDPDIRYSIKTDSQGRTLTEQQREYFKDSKAVDDQGRLMVMYHGTRKSGFTVFRDWSYLTANRKYAERYMDRDTGETMYEVYANIKKPFDTRMDECRAIWENEFYGEYSRTSLQGSGLPDWTDGYDLVDFLEENGYDYDAILLDEGADQVNGSIVERGISYVVRSSEQIKSITNENPTSDPDIRYSRSNRDILDAYVKEYGAIPRGEKPSREIVLPKKTAGGKNLSQTVRTILEAGATPDEMVPDIEKLAARGAFSYDAYTDKQAISDARNKISGPNGIGWSSAQREWFDAMRHGEVSKANTAMGWALYNNAANSGDTALALDILNQMVEHQRSAAQALQATRILKKLSPETQLYGVQRSVAKLQEELNNQYGEKGGPELKVDQELAERFLQAKDEEARDEALKDIYRDIGRQMPSRFRDKWNAWRYLAMLGNPRTHVRNVVGNAGFAPVVAAKNLTATAIEAAVYRVSGGKLDRNKGLVLPGKKGRALLEAAWNDYAKVQETALGGGKYSDFANANKYVEEGRVIFRTKALEKARKANSAALDAEDVWFSKPHYAYAMAQYCKAHNITPEQIATGKGLKQARAYAVLEAQKATYRDTNALSQTISEFGRSIRPGKNQARKVVSLAMEGILPFRKTPANILARGLEYSPIGLMNGIKQAVWDVQKGKKTGAEAIDSISTGLTGTGLLALGAWLAAQGLVRGHGGGDEKENELEELMGHQTYAMELPNGTSVTLDWLAPEALPFFVGVNLWEQTGGEQEDVTLASVLSAVSTVSEPMLEMSCLQSLNDVFDAVGYASSEGLDGLPAALASAATSYLTQSLPTILGQAERTGEDKRYTTYTEKNAFLTGDMQYTLGRASARIPGWDYQQIPYIDAWGRVEQSGNTGARAFNNFLNPSYTSTINESEMETELLRLYEATGESGVLPSRARKYFTVDKEQKDLTAEEYVQYAMLKGQTSYDLVTELTQSVEYQSMSDEEKVKAVKDSYDLANQSAKAAVSDYTPDAWIGKAAEAYKKYGISQETYITLKTNAAGIQSLKDADGKTISNSKGLQIMEMVYDTTGLTDKQRKAMFEYLGVGKSVQHYNKAAVKEKLDNMRKQSK